VVGLTSARALGVRLLRCPRRSERRGYGGEVAARSDIPRRRSADLPMAA
jgi:hypothetical protein